MPIPRRCAKGGSCREFQPCPKHGTSNWLNNKSDPLPSDWHKRKIAVFRRDGRICRQCGSTKGLQVDHIFGRAYGGSDELSNLQVLCGPCHRIKTTADKKKYGGKGGPRQ